MRPLAHLLALAVACEPTPVPLPLPLPGLESRPIAAMLGETRLAFGVHGKAPQGGLACLVVHDDEDTAVRAGLERVRSRGGRLVELRAQGERYLRFQAEGREWSIDSNRIFTDTGARRMLIERNGEAPEPILRAVRRFADDLLAAYGRPPVIVTLHNNTAGAWSAASYAPGGREAGQAAAVHLPDGANPDDFFFTTDRRIYEALLPEGFPVVLQDNASATDDGSLSVWAAQQGQPYVNVEARHGQEVLQLRMLEVLALALARCGLLP